MFFYKHKDYKNLEIGEILYLALRHVIDEEIAPVYYLNIGKTEIDIEDFKEWTFTMENYTKKFELDNEKQYECPICLVEF